MPVTYTVEQAAQLLGVSVFTVRRWIAAGRLPDRRIPGARKYWFYPEDLRLAPSPNTPQQ